MYCGFAAYVDMIFLDSKKVILVKRGPEQILLWASPGIYS